MSSQDSNRSPGVEWVSSATWYLNKRDCVAQPTDRYLQDMNTWLSNHVKDESAIRFRFSYTYHEPDIFIHQSRLEYVGGPLAALTREGFSEHENKVVELSEEDDPVTMTVIKDFLYGKHINIYDMRLCDTVRAVRASHRWQLDELVEVLCDSMICTNMLNGGEDILLAANVIRLPHLPPSFREHFWEEVGKNFDSFSHESDESNEEKPCTNNDVNVRLNPKFPDLWQLALEDDMVVRVIRLIIIHSIRITSEDLLTLILVYLEPRIKSDKEVCGLLGELEFDGEWWDSSAELDLVSNEKCSIRGTKLLVMAALRPNSNRMEWRTTLELNLVQQAMYEFRVDFEPTVRVPDDHKTRDWNYPGREENRENERRTFPVVLKISVFPDPDQTYVYLHWKGMRECVGDPNADVQVVASYWKAQKEGQKDLTSSTKPEYICSDVCKMGEKRELSKLNARFSTRCLNKYRNRADGSSWITLSLLVRKEVRSDEMDE